MMTSTADIRRMLAEIESGEATDQAEKSLLLAEIPTLARYLNRHVSAAWMKLATGIMDDPGHYDSSYPPDEYVAARTKKRLLRVSYPTTTERETSGGFYGTFDISTDEPGVAIGTDGTIYSIDEAGTAKTSPYAAYPGTDHRDIHLSYRPVASPDLDVLRSAANLLRTMRAALTADSPAPYIADDERGVVIAALHNPRLTANDAEHAYTTTTSRAVKAVAGARMTKLQGKAS